MESFNFTEVTEIANTLVSKEQLDRIRTRYLWASKFCSSKDVIEIACGTGQGLNLIIDVSNSVKAGDISEEMIAMAKETYFDSNISFSVIDAHRLPYNDKSADVIIFFEALYYLVDMPQFINELKRVLRRNGELLISTANRDLFDFNPSPYSNKYYGAKELNELFTSSGFKVELFGDVSVKDILFIQKIFRLIKYFAVKLKLIPITMIGKKLLKRLVFGKLVKMPTKLLPNSNYEIELDKIQPELNKEFKVILMRASL